MLIGTEGSGKTTTAAYAPNSVILMARGEYGYETLYQHNRAPERSCIALTTWVETLAILDDLAANPGEHKLVALDAMGGFERLCHEHVCDVEFKGVWGEKGFMSYHRGYSIAIPEWVTFLCKLDALRNAGMTVLLLAHSQIKPFKNPVGDDYDRFTSDCHEKTWGQTHKWADGVFFLNFLTITDDKKGRARGIGDTVRMLFGGGAGIVPPHERMWDTIHAEIMKGVK